MQRYWQWERLAGNSSCFYFLPTFFSRCCFCVFGPDLPNTNSSQRGKKQTTNCLQPFPARLHTFALPTHDLLPEKIFKRLSVLPLLSTSSADISQMPELFFFSVISNLGRSETLLAFVTIKDMIRVKMRWWPVRLLNLVWTGVTPTHSRNEPHPRSIAADNISYSLHSQSIQFPLQLSPVPFLIKYCNLHPKHDKLLIVASYRGAGRP